MLATESDTYDEGRNSKGQGSSLHYSHYKFPRPDSLWRMSSKMREKESEMLSTVHQEKIIHWLEERSRRNRKKSETGSEPSSSSTSSRKVRGGRRGRRSGHQSGSIVNIKMKISRTLDYLKEAGQREVQKQRKGKNRSFGERQQRPVVAAGMAVSTTTLHEDVETTSREEKAGLELKAIDSILDLVEGTHYETMKKEEEKRDEMRVRHEEWTDTQMDTLRRMEENKEDLVRQLANYEKSALTPVGVGGTPRTAEGEGEEGEEDGPKPEKHLKSQIAAINRHLRLLKKTVDKERRTFRKEMKAFDEQVNQRRASDVQTIELYKASKRKIESILQKQLMLRTTLMEHAIKDPSSNDALLDSTRWLPKDFSSSSSSSLPSSFSVSSSQAWQSLDSFRSTPSSTTPTILTRERGGSLPLPLPPPRTLMTSAVRQMKWNEGFKELTTQQDLRDIEGYSLSGELLGKFGLAKVFKAKFHVYANETKDMACKVFQITDVQSEVEKHLQTNGVHILRYLKSHPHKNVVQIQDLFLVSHNGVFIFEELLSINLETLVRQRGGPLSEKVVQFYARQMAEGINYLNRIGVAHQNLNPSTVHRTREGILKLAGIEYSIIYWDPQREKAITQRRFLTREERRSGGGSGSGHGSLLERINRAWYWAPETTLATDYDPRKVDVYSLGKILVYLLTSGADNEAQTRVGESTELTQEGKDLIQSCLQELPTERLSIKKVLHNPWMSLDSVLNKPESESMNG